MSFLILASAFISCSLTGFFKTFEKALSTVGSLYPSAFLIK